MDEVTGEWRKFNYEELHDLYWSSDVIQLIKQTEVCGACHMYGVGEKCRQGFCRETGRKETTWKT